MAAQTTALTVFSDKDNARTFTYTGHTASNPKLVIQKRRVASGSQTVAEDTVQVLSGTVDAESVPLAQRVSMTVTIRRPIDGASTDVDAVLVVLRDIVAGDEFGNTVDTQEYLA